MTTMTDPAARPSEVRVHPLRWLGQRDRGFAALRRATRAAIIMPAMFALGDKVIGNPQDLEPALNIPGGVVQTLEKEQATVTVRRADKIVVDALRAAKRPDYARSSSR